MTNESETGPMRNDTTREVVEAFDGFIKGILHGDTAHRAWLLEEAERFKSETFTALLTVPPRASFQQRVDGWMDACFTAEIKSDMIERADRFTEEALELVQTIPGFSADRAHALVDYVFGRDTGERQQEVGGVMVTLAALCNPAGVDMVLAAETELKRISDPATIQKIRAKQAAKPTGSALPVATPARPDPSTEEVEQIRARHLLAEADLWTFRADDAGRAHRDRATLLRKHDNNQHDIQVKNSQIDELQELLDAARAELAEVESLLEQCHEFFGEMYLNGVSLPEAGEQHLERVASRVAAALKDKSHD